MHPSMRPTLTKWLTYCLAVLTSLSPPSSFESLQHYKVTCFYHRLSLFLLFPFIYLFIYLRVREREQEHAPTVIRGGVEEEGERKRIPGRLHTVSADLNAGLELSNLKIMT